MKIGIIGNMNNAYFSLSRYLRDAGHDCEVLIFNNEPSHFHPSCDTDSDEYKTYCRVINWGDPANFFSDDFDQIRKDLDIYDFLIGNGPAPAYVARVGKKLDIFMPYGYDLYSLPFYKLVHPLRIPAYLKTGYYQKKGIREASYILFDRTNEKFESMFNKLHYQGRRIVCAIPMVYHKEYDKSLRNAGNEVHGIDLDKIRTENDLVFVQHVRQIWKNPPDFWSGKGNNKLIEGYARFLETHPGIKSVLVLFEYGTDVAASKRLIRQCRIEDQVIWMPKMSRKELMRVLGIADLIIGELHHSWISYGVVLEALSIGKPIMHYRRDEEYVNDYPVLYPMLNANSAGTVYSGLEYFVANQCEMRSIGARGKEWFLEHCVKRAVSSIGQIIRERSLAAYD